MIWYKSSSQERSSPLGAKMGRGSPVCQQIREKIIEMFKNNVPQRKIGRDLDISPSTVHNIIKRFKESGGISVRKGQGRKPKLNNRDLRSLRRHCIKNRHSSISDITTWAQDYFGKPLSSTTIRSYIHKCQLKLYCAKRKPYVNSVQKRRRLLWARRHLGWTITQWKCVLWSDESVFQVFFGRNGRRVLRTKEEKDHPDCYQQQVQKPGSVMVWGCVSALGKGNLHFCDGTINAEKYIEILEHNMLPIFCVHIVCNEIQVKVNLEITTFFFYLRFPYGPNFFWFGVVFLVSDKLQYGFSVFIWVFRVFFSLFCMKTSGSQFDQRNKKWAQIFNTTGIQII